MCFIFCVNFYNLFSYITRVVFNENYNVSTSECNVSKYSEYVLQSNYLITTLKIAFSAIISILVCNFVMCLCNKLYILANIICTNLKN